MRPKYASAAPGCAHTAMSHQSTASRNVLAPSEEEIAAFFEKVKSIHPKSL